MKKMSREKGFLSIVAIIIIVIVALICVAATYQFVSDSRQSVNSLNSAQAFYMAQSGLEAAEHAIVTNKNSCTSINDTTNYTNATFTGAPGTFTVTGTLTQASNTLSSALTSSATTIPLVSSSGFASSGEISIDSEYIYYTGISGNNLTGAVRGVAGSTAAGHNSAAGVTQDACVLNSTGYDPNSTSPLAKRLLQETFITTGFSLGTSPSGGSLTPALVTLGSVSVSGPASIINNSVTSGSKNFQGSTILSANGNTVFNNNGNTQISNGSGGLVVSSQSGSIKSDILSSYSSINSGNLFGLYFKGKSKSTIQAAADQSYTTANSLNGVTGKTIWFKNYFNPSSGTTIGSAASPVILIINENAQISSGVTIYGLVYVVQGLSMGGGSIIGAAATENALNINGNNSSITFNPAVLAALSGVNSNFGGGGYVSLPANLIEIIP